MGTEIKGVTGDIYRSLQTLFSTPAGTLVHDREYGIDWNGVDYPPDVAEAMLIAEAVEKAERYEPRVIIEDVVTEAETDGTLRIRTVIAYANQESASG